MRLKTLSLWQPWASLVEHGHKTKYRDWLAIHAAKTKVGPEGPWGPLLAEPGSALLRDDVRPLPLGAIVATAKLVDCVIIGRCHDPYAPEVPEFALAVHWMGDKAWHVVGDTAADVTDQLPFGDYSPGRYAWLLADIKPTTERCPACMEGGLEDGIVHCLVHRGQPMDEACFACWNGEPCPVCDGAGRCDPIPAKGRQGLWNWDPVPSSTPTTTP